MENKSLKQMRIDSGLKTSKITEALGITRTQLYNIEKGKNSLSDAKAIKLCLLYHKDIEEIKNSKRGEQV